MKRSPTRYILIIGFLACLLTTPIPIYAQLSLPPNKTVERELTGSETHQYKFKLKAGAFLQIRVEQKGVDVALKLIDEEGITIAAMDSPNGKEGLEVLSLIAGRAGGYVLEIAGYEASAVKGSYLVARQKPRSPAPGDLRRVAVEREFVAGLAAAEAEGQFDIAVQKLGDALAGWRELNEPELLEMTSNRLISLKRTRASGLTDEAFRQLQAGKAESLRSALQLFATAAQLYADIDDRTEKAGVAIVGAGMASDQLGAKTDAIRLFQQAVSFFRTNNFPVWEGTALSNLGLALAGIGDRQRALEMLDQSLALRRRTGDKNGEAVTLTNIGGIYGLLGQAQKALEFHMLSLPIFREIGSKNGEASALNNIGQVYRGVGEKHKALEYYEQSRKIVQQLGDRRGEAVVLYNVGQIHSDLGERAKAIEFYNLALPIFRDIGDPSGESFVLNGLGQVSSENGEKKVALQYFEDTLKLLRRIGDKAGEAGALNNIAQVNSELGEKQVALEYFNQALPLLRQVGNKAGEAVTLSNIGLIYSELSQTKRGLESLEAALLLARESGDRNVEGGTLNNIGQIYFQTGQTRKAIEFLTKVQEMFAATGNRTGQAVALNNIGSGYLTLGDVDKAVDHFNRAMLFSREVGDPGHEAYALANLGLVHLRARESRKALEFYDKALPITRQVGDKRGEALVLSNMMVAWEALQNAPLAVFYGKQSVNRYQELRSRITGLDKDFQTSYLRSVEPAYRKLADLLIAQGGFAQAERVLAMLKEEEFFSFVRRDASEIGKLEERVPLNDKEKALIAQYTQLADKITEIGGVFTKLDDKKRLLSRNELTLSPEEQKQYEELEKQLDAANAAFQLFLSKQLTAEIGKEKAKEIEVDRNLQSKLRQWGEGTVALYTIAGADRYRVVLTTAKTQVDGKSEIKVADLNKKIFDFRNALQNPKVDPRPLGKELYDILLKPIERDLKAAKAKTLVWSLDGTLRYIPLAALSPDGKRYLAEDVQNVIITAKTRDDMTDSNADWQGLGLGVSEGQTVTDPENSSRSIPFDPLPGTESELISIVKDERFGSETGLLLGRRFMNKDFTAAALKDSLAKENPDGTRKYNLIHIASHFRLGSNWANSFLLLGGGSVLSLEEINNSSTIDFGNVDLITLSACNTAFADDSNGKEIDSLASVIQTKSGKAVLATLWPVADESTSMLMSEFYRLRKENPKLTKAGAMQLAQQAMIAGKLRSSGKTIPCRSDKIDLGDAPSEFKCDTNAPFAHPYFWAPFVLIGNWR